MRLKALRISMDFEMESLYRFLGTSRQVVYRKISRHQKKQELIKTLEPIIHSYREKKDRRAGSRSLYYNLNIKEQFDIGVTKFEQLLSSHHLTISPLRLRIVTTQSDCQSWNYDNLVKGLEITGINQVVAGDLTYLYIGSQLYYLFCLMDLFDAYLVGIHASDRMRSIDAEAALQDWIKLRGANALESCIHHTDGGKQYFSAKYLKLLANHGIRISVAQDCLENGYAEQRNFFIKEHLIPCKRIQNLKELKHAVEEIKYFYNHERKQAELGWRTPQEYDQYASQLPAGSLRFKLFEGKKGRRVLKGISQPKIDLEKKGAP